MNTLLLHCLLSTTLLSLLYAHTTIDKNFSDANQITENYSTEEESLSQINKETKMAIVDTMASQDISVITSEPAKKSTSKIIFEEDELQADFPGGRQQLLSWLSENLVYPEAAVKNKIEGRVIVQFRVEKDGSITAPCIARGVDPELDREALRLVNAMPRWIPARRCSEVVCVKYILPIVFKLPK